MSHFALALTLCGATFTVQAQELSVLGGGLKATRGGEPTYTWQIDYQHDFGEIVAFGGGWINEGHVPGHHRDGANVQIRARAHPFDPRLTLTAGIGPYIYFDTVPAANADGSHDDHGVGIVASVAATWNLQGPWSLELRANHIATGHSIDTTSVLLGVGYRLDERTTAYDTSAAAPRSFDREVAVMAGRTIVNTLESEDASAAQLEYRQAFDRRFAWSAALLNEGDARTQRRSGAVAQIWMGRALWDARMTAAIGIGPYLVFDIKRNPLLAEASRERLAGIVSLSAAYAPVPHWAVRLTWSRVFAERSHDTDVLLLGAGYRF